MFKSGQAVTTSDVTTYEPYFSALWIGGAGNVAITLLNGVSVTFTAVPVGTLLPICGRQVKATGTTATNIVALFG